MRCVIFDIDGTLANVDHRLHYLEGAEKNWNGFFGDQHLDTVIEPVAWLAQLIHHNPSVKEVVLVVSARPDDYRGVTEKWLADNGIGYDKLYMRKAGDFRPDNVVKSEILQQILEDGYDPFMVVDDRPQVVAMWRSFGLVCLQCAPDEGRKSRFQGKTLLHMLVGPSGSGKSTYCKKHYKEGDIVSSDAVRRMLFGGHEEGQGHNPDELALTWRYVHGLIKLRMENGIFTVLDATNLKPKDRKSVLAQVPEGIVVQYVVIDRDYDAKIADRGWRPVELIDKHHRQMKSNIRGILDADGLGNVIVVDARS